VFVAKFWTGFALVGYASMTTGELAINFFEVYLAAPIILISYVGYKTWFKTRFVKVSEMDLVTGRRESAEDEAVLKEMDRVEFEGLSWWRKAYRLLSEMRRMMIARSWRGGLVVSLVWNLLVKAFRVSLSEY
jgi:amino acid transporter